MLLDARGKSLPFVTKKAIRAKMIQTELLDPSFTIWPSVLLNLSSVSFGSAITLRLEDKDIKAFICAFGSYLQYCFYSRLFF